MTTYLPHILAGVASFAAATLWTLWRVAQHEVEKLSDQLTKAADWDEQRKAEIERLKSDVNLFWWQKNNANVRVAQLEAEIERLKETIADLKRNATPRNEKGKFTRKPEAERSERSRKRDRQRAKATAKMTDTFLAVSRGEMVNPFEMKPITPLK